MDQRFGRSFLKSIFRFCTRAILTLALTALPALQLRLWLWMFFHSRIADYVPFAGDWIMYWHEAASVAAHGVFVGFYGNEETTSVAASLVHSGLSFTHSLLFPMLQGGYGWIFGWNAPSPLYWNIAVVAFSLALFCLLAGTWSTLLMALAFVAVFPPLSFQLGIANQEATNMALGILLATLLVRFFRASTPRLRAKRRSWALACTFMACLVRMDWVIAFIPLFYAPGPWMQKPNAWITRTLALAALSGAGVLGYVLFVSPYPYELYPEAPVHGMNIFVRLAMGDTAPFFRLMSLNAHYIADPANLVQNPSVLAALLFFVLGQAVALVRHQNATSQAERHEAIFISLTLFSNIALLLLIFMIYYPMLQADRIIIPHLLLSFFALAGLMPVQTVIVFLCFNLAFAVKSLEIGRDLLTTDFGYNHLLATSLQEQKTKLASVLHFEPNAPSWCNTLLLLGCEIEPVFQGMPAGIGLQYMRVIPSNLQDPYPYSHRSQDKAFASRYLFIRDPDVLRVASRSTVLAPLLVLPSGTLYQNLSCPCGGPTVP